MGRNHRYELSRQAQNDVCSILNTSDDNKLCDYKNQSRLTKEIDVVLETARNDGGYIILSPVEGLEGRLREFTVLVSDLIGESVVQNGDGLRIVEVFDRDPTKRMKDGARYHQTHQGGSIHTDNVNLQKDWDVLLLTCGQPSKVGGESIFVDGIRVFEALDENVPEACAILQESFWFEFRGFSDDVYQAPVIGFDQLGHPCFRYLRDYITAAHDRVGVPLSAEQMWALDALDSILESSEYQYRTQMIAGEVAVVMDGAALHGRTSYVDSPSSNGLRKMYRTWVCRHHR